jgi:hypothetical protein
MSAVPAEFETMIEFGAKDVEPVPPFAMVLENDPPPTHVPAIAKHPPVRLIPPVDENVEVAVEKLIPFVFPTESSEPGEVVPIPTLPEEFILSASLLVRNPPVYTLKSPVDTISTPEPVFERRAFLPAK